MRKLVLCFAHKDPYLINTQIEQLLANGSDTDIYIHLDKKSEKLKSEIIQNEHVFFIKNSVSVKWGDDTMMKAVFASFDEIAHNGKTYDWFIITTGQDLLVKKGLDNFLNANPGKVFLDARSDKPSIPILLTHKVPSFLCNDSYSLPFYHPKRLMMSLYFRLIKYNIIPKKQIEYDTSKLKFMYSFNWSVMPYKVFSSCADFLSTNPHYKKLYQRTLLPEDGFLATLIINSQYAGDIVWKDEIHTRSLTFHDEFDVHPKVIRISDVDEIKNSDCYFARKFDSKIDKQVIEYYKHLIIE